MIARDPLKWAGGAAHRHLPGSAATMPRRAVLAGLAGLALPACTPARAPMGPPVTRASIADDALVMPDGVRLPVHAWLPPSPPRAVVVGCTA